MQAHKIIIAIDGYSSCGKSTLARELAARLGYNYIDSGAMYRAITLYFLRNQVDYSDHGAILDAIANINLHFEFNEQDQRSDIHLNDEDVEPYIRDMIVSEKVSEVAAIREVRSFAVGQQKRMGRKKGIVMDGRDIGTTVFPDAELKIFMTATPEVRVERRKQELLAKGIKVKDADIKRNILKRDEEDSTRLESPLRQAPDAILLDNTKLTREQQLGIVLRWAKERIIKNS